MTEFVKITNKPTFDLEEIHITSFDVQNGLLFFQTNKVFRFDNVFGNLENRSRVLRIDKEESSFVEQVISASIDAGFCGRLVWKTKLTIEGQNLVKRLNNFEQTAKYFCACQQLHLLPSPAGNYYTGTNQTNLIADVVFTL